MPNSPEHNRKISEARKARKIVPWNKGKKWDADTIEKMKAWHRENKEIMHEKLIGHRSSLKGRTISEEHRSRIKANSARPWLGKHLSEEHKTLLSQRQKGKHSAPKTLEHRAKIAAAHKALWKNRDYANRKYREFGKKPTRPEITLLTILNELFPGEWKYTGDFTLMIDGRCPDFVNVNGQKKIIELFGDYWHRGQDPSGRASVFAPFGYETLVIWEHELKNTAAVQEKLESFARARKCE